MALPLSFMPVRDEASEALDQRQTFTDMTQAGTRVWPRDQVALLVRHDTSGFVIPEIGTVTRSYQRVATGWHRLRYVRRIEISPVEINQLVAATPDRFQRIVEDRALVGGMLTEKSSAAVIDAMTALQPAVGEALQRMVGADAPQLRQLRDDSLQAAAQEADAARLALDIADIPRKALRDLRPDGGSSFLEQLEGIRAAEDTTVAYDGMQFLDFDRIESPSGAVMFAKGHERLTVVNVNRQPLERTTGADLIYINETQPSFVLVQYKTMRRENGDPPKLVYRPDAQLTAELDRMRKIKPGADDGSPASFRLSPTTCFLKLCKPVARLGRAQDLVSGMYLPLDYYDVLAGSDDVRGPLGGVVFSYETVARHVDNTLFVSLVRGGWIGSRGLATKRLEKLVLAGLDADRSVTVAAASRRGTRDDTDR